MPPKQIPATTYCVKCKRKTANVSIGKPTKTKNGAFMIKSKCKACGTAKTTFVGSK